MPVFEIFIPRYTYLNCKEAINCETITVDGKTVTVTAETPVPPSETVIGTFGAEKYIFVSNKKGVFIVEKKSRMGYELSGDMETFGDLRRCMENQWEVQETRWENFYHEQKYPGFFFG